MDRGIPDFGGARQARPLDRRGIRSKERTHAKGQVHSPGGKDGRGGRPGAPVRCRRPFADADGHARHAHAHSVADAHRQPLSHSDRHADADRDANRGPADCDRDANAAVDLHARRQAAGHAAPASAYTAAAGDVSRTANGPCRRRRRQRRWPVAAPAGEPPGSSIKRHGPRHGDAGPHGDAAPASHGHAPSRPGRRRPGAAPDPAFRPGWRWRPAASGPLAELAPEPGHRRHRRGRELGLLLPHAPPARPLTVTAWLATPRLALRARVVVRRTLGTCQGYRR
jgi:hypothetical protein